MVFFSFFKFVICCDLFSNFNKFSISYVVLYSQFYRPFLKDSPQNCISFRPHKTWIRLWDRLSWLDFFFLFPLGPSGKGHVSSYAKSVLGLQRLMVIVLNLLWGLGRVKEWRFLDVSTNITIIMFRRNESGDSLCPQVWGIRDKLVNDYYSRTFRAIKTKAGKPFPDGARTQP